MNLINLNKNKIQVDVVSDVVCPWCYVGKKRIETAMRNLATEFDFEVTYRPFQLDARIPVTGVDQKQYFMNKFGGEERMETIFNQVEAAGESVGIDFRFRDIPKAINTLGLHAILSVAHVEGIQIEVKQALFEAYMVQPVDMTDEKNIAAIMQEFGWNEAKTFSVLHDQQILEEVKAEILEMQQLGVTGVPFFIINQKYGVSGAQQSQTFEEIFRNLKPEDFPTSENIACEIGGDC